MRRFARYTLNAVRNFFWQQNAHKTAVFSAITSAKITKVNMAMLFHVGSKVKVVVVAFELLSMSKYSCSKPSCSRINAGIPSLLYTVETGIAKWNDFGRRVYCKGDLTNYHWWTYLNSAYGKSTRSHKSGLCWCLKHLSVSAAVRARPVLRLSLRFTERHVVHWEFTRSGKFVLLGLPNQNYEMFLSLSTKWNISYHWIWKPESGNGESPTLNNFFERSAKFESPCNM